MSILGLHHVTAIAGDPQRNLDFHVGVLGLRLVKRTINFDDPGSYHFYFGDAAGTPGTILTFFPWPHAHRGARGVGEVETTAFSIPADSAGYWVDRLQAHGVTVESTPARFGGEVIRFADPDGMLFELVTSAPDDGVQIWADGPVPAGHALRGFHGVTARVADLAPTAELLTRTLGYQLVGEDGDHARFSVAGGIGTGKFIDLIGDSKGLRGRSGAGSVHHIAFRVADDDQQAAWRKKLVSLGYQVSPVMDRSYFHSIYFREPGGVLFEIATDTPGFATDESVKELGENLRLPTWMEKSRPMIEELLPKITLPAETTL